MHIHSSSPNSSISEEDAATKIQAGFRGYRVRKQMKEKLTRNTNSNQQNGHSNNQQKPNGFRLKSAKSIEVEDRCATKIQAGIRGYLVRKRQKLVENAAIKIQAGFRGFRTRKQLKNQTE